jgi:hypothetical protein
MLNATIAKVKIAIDTIFFFNFIQKYCPFEFHLNVQLFFLFDFSLGKEKKLEAI